MDEENNDGDYLDADDEVSDEGISKQPQEIYDEVTEWQEDPDTAKIKQQDDEIEQWFDACEVRKYLATTAEEKSERIKKCEQRFAFMLNILVQTAKTFSKHGRDQVKD
ncbi:MAG: hypothetical protein Q9222_003829 [Ikaeria aurantiellina]